MGYNIAGLTVGHSYNGEIDMLAKDLGLEISVIEEVDFEAASRNWLEEGQFYVFFGKYGTMLFFEHDAVENQWCSALHDSLSFAYSATAMSFHMQYFEQGSQVRRLFIHEDQKHIDEGDPLPLESSTSGVDDLIFQLMDRLMQESWQAIELGAKAYRCTVARSPKVIQASRLQKLSIIHQAEVFRKEVGEVIGDLGYTLDSLHRVESFIEKTIPQPGKPLHKSYFQDDLEDKAFALGCYTGEVIRRQSHTPSKWDVAGSDPTDVSIVLSDGTSVLVINKAYKRIYNGEEDNIMTLVRMAVQRSKEEVDSSSFKKDATDSYVSKYGDSLLCLMIKKDHQDVSPIVEAMCQSATWVLVTQDAEPHAADSDVESDFVFMAELEEQYPALLALMEEHDPTEGSRIRRESDGSFRYQTAHKGLLFDSSAMAAFQGNMKLKPVQWIKTNTGKVLKASLALVVSFALMVGVHWAFVFVFIPALLFNGWYWLTVRSTFGGGNVSPGKVVSVNPTRVAVFTDMSKGYGGSFPILKIVEAHLAKPEREVGKFIPTVGVYNDNPHGYPFWSEFHPVPVSNGIVDMAKYEYFMERFGQDDYDIVEQSLLEVNSLEPGIYKLQEEGSGWNEYRHTDISKGVHLEGPPQGDA
jgi:hypothetical protein